MASIGIMAAGTALFFAGRSALKTASEYQQSRIAFDTMLGSAEKGQKMMKELSDFAKKTPFNLPQVVEGAKSLLAYRISADKIIPTFNALGNIAAGVGREKLPQLTLAFGQVRTAGKLTGQELRQFTEAGVPLLDVLAQQSGKTASQIKEDMEKGIAPSFGEVEKALFSMSEKGGTFYNLMEKQSQTFAGRMSNIGDTVGQIIRGMLGIDVEGNVKPGSIFDKVSNAAEKLMTFLENNKDRIINALQTAFSFIEQHGDKIAVFIGVILVGAFASLAVSVISATWPILLVAAAFTGLYMLYQRFKPQIDSLINKFKMFWNALKPLRDFIVGQFKLAWNDLKKAFDDVKKALEPHMPMLKKLGLAFIAVQVTIGIFVTVVITFIIRLIAWVARVIGWFGRIGSSMSSAMSKMAGAVANGIGGVIRFFNGLQSKVIGALGNVGRWLYDAGGKIMQGLIDGIRNQINSVKSAVSDVMNAARNLMPFSPAKEGPFSGKGYTTFSGMAMMKDLAKGIEQSAVLPRNAMTRALSGMQVNGASQTPQSNTSIYGNISIGNKQDADYFFKRLNRDQELLSFGLTTTGGYK
jgi:tape measure domain-containing protein